MSDVGDWTVLRKVVATEGPDMFIKDSGSNLRNLQQ